MRLFFAELQQLSLEGYRCRAEINAGPPETDRRAIPVRGSVELPPKLQDEIFPAFWPLGLQVFANLGRWQQQSYCEIEHIQITVRFLDLTAMK